MKRQGSPRVMHFFDLHYVAHNLAEANLCIAAAIERALEMGALAARATQQEPG